VAKAQSFAEKSRKEKSENIGKCDVTGKIGPVINVKLVTSKRSEKTGSYRFPSRMVKIGEGCSENEVVKNLG